MGKWSLSYCNVYRCHVVWKLDVWMNVQSCMSVAMVTVCWWIIISLIKNIENDALRSTFGHVVDELQAMLVSCYGNRLLMDSSRYTLHLWHVYYMSLLDTLFMKYSRLILMSAILDFWLNKCHIIWQLRAYMMLFILLNELMLFGYVLCVQTINYPTY